MKGRIARSGNHLRLPWLNERLVLEPDRGRMRELLLALLLSGLMLLPLLFYVRQSSEWLRAGYRIEKLKNQRDHLNELNQELRLEKASLQNLVRVETVAAGQLGLAQPPGGTVVLVDTKHLPSRLASAMTLASPTTLASPHQAPKENRNDAADRRQN